MAEAKIIERRSIGSMPHPRLGPIWLALSPRGLVGLHMKSSEESVRRTYRAFDADLDPVQASPILDQLAAYFEGKSRRFDVPIDWSVLSPFQQEVLQLVFAIPFAHTRTYVDIATQLGKPGAARAVGRANATNPMPIIIPCHRVLGADGTLHGYGGPGGVETKAWLLRHEGSWLL